MRPHTQITVQALTVCRCELIKISWRELRPHASRVHAHIHCLLIRIQTLLSSKTRKSNSTAHYVPQAQCSHAGAHHSQHVQTRAQRGLGPRPPFSSTRMSNTERTTKSINPTRHLGPSRILAARGKKLSRYEPRERHPSSPMGSLTNSPIRQGAPQGF